MTTISIQALYDCDQLQQRGYAITNLYGDGVVRLAKALPGGDAIVAWLELDGGLKRPPALWSDYRAAGERRRAVTATAGEIVVA